MSQFTNIGVKHAVAARFRELADAHRLHHHELVERVVAALDGMSFESQERMLGLRASRASARTSNTRRRGAKDAA